MLFGYFSPPVSSINKIPGSFLQSVVGTGESMMTINFVRTVRLWFDSWCSEYG